MSTNLDIVSSVIIATLAEQSMRDCLVHVNLIEHRIGVLKNCELRIRHRVGERRTLLTLAV
jgi:hypothetical protein